MTTYAEYKRLPAEERDRLGFAKWQEEQESALIAGHEAATRNLTLHELHRKQVEQARALLDVIGYRKTP